jgi:hypothetical protein
VLQNHQPETGILECHRSHGRNDLQRANTIKFPFFVRSWASDFVVHFHLLKYQPWTLQRFALLLQWIGSD